jgi:hypothetical protein
VNFGCIKGKRAIPAAASAKNAQTSTKYTTNEQQINNKSTTVESQVHHEPATRQIDTTAILDVLR